jgi:hypothetical protein
MEAGYDARGRRGGSLFQEVGVKACANGGMGEIPLHGIFLFLRLSFNSVELDPLPLDVSKTRVLCTQCMDVGNDARISEMEESVVDDQAIV